MKSQTANEKGFTLIETSIAMLVMLVVGLGASSLFLYAVRNNRGGAQRSLAMAIAQQRIEDLRNVDYTDARLNFGVHPTENVVIEGTTPASAYSQYGGYTTQSYTAQSYAAPSSSMGGTATGAAAPAPTPYPTPGTGGTTPAPVSTGSSRFQVQTQVDPFPAGAATPTQKVVRIRVTPVNGDGTNSWINQNPVEVVIRRSSTTPGPNKL
ncbi:MAG TPA: prepilin-type N-terminal cleavage/methylation domain-containing protein [Pyrinomonadaceae bacterium]|nr:prepilin-type N-terminal cleavage/methylation domain-containing protein [Pyrinomonadaceae bacterium]